MNTQAKEKTYKSDSTEQRQAGEEIFEKVRDMLGVPLMSNPKVFFSEDPKVHIEPDFYSETDSIIGEIYAHIGKPKAAQLHKIAGDILKMNLLEKKRGREFQKYFVVCDDEVIKALTGYSFLAESIRSFDIKLVKIELSEEQRQMLTGAQKRQRMINA